jgi:hypothetical protein
MPDSKFIALSDLQARTLRYSFTGLGWIGAVLISYGIVAEITGEKWIPLEHIAEQLSSALTILGTVVVALSVYFFKPSTPPEPTLQYVLSPLVIAASCAALIALIWFGRLPIVVVNVVRYAGVGWGASSTAARSLCRANFKLRHYQPVSGGLFALVHLHQGQREASALPGLAAVVDVGAGVCRR